MTYQRFIHRNRIETGDYGTKMSGLNIGDDTATGCKPLRSPFNLTREDFPQAAPDFSMEEYLRQHGRTLEDEIRSLNWRWGLVLGDLRRLEADAVDENRTCAHIASRTGVDAEVVAAVLKEFLAF